MILQLKFMNLVLGAGIVLGGISAGISTNEAQASVKLKTSTGVVFTQFENHPILGQSWCDPKGLCWGDVMRNSNGRAGLMDQYNAEQFCSSKGAQLPTKEQYEELSKSFGQGSPSGYSAQVLPHLNKRVYWTSSVDQDLDLVVKSNKDNAVFAYYFSGQEGLIGKEVRSDYLLSVRCVAPKKAPRISS